jgi:hypothetical protein
MWVATMKTTDDSVNQTPSDDGRRCGVASGDRCEVYGRLICDTLAALVGLGLVTVKQVMAATDTPHPSTIHAYINGEAAPPVGFFVAVVRHLHAVPGIEPADAWTVRRALLDHLGTVERGHEDGEAAAADAKYDPRELVAALQQAVADETIAVLRAATYEPSQRIFAQEKLTSAWRRCRRALYALGVALDHEYETIIESRHNRRPARPLSPAD